MSDATREGQFWENWVVLYVEQETEAKITEVLVKKCGFPLAKVARGMHLTIYHSRRYMPDLCLRAGFHSAKVKADVAETRFMILAPGGENARPDQHSRRNPVGIRLTKRNIAIPRILELRQSFLQFETSEAMGARRNSTRWRSAFGAREYQPHIKLIEGGSGIECDLREVGSVFRQELTRIRFGRMKVSSREPLPSD